MPRECEKVGQLQKSSQYQYKVCPQMLVRGLYSLIYIPLKTGGWHFSINSGKLWFMLPR